MAVTTALARWFKGKELSLAFGLNLTIARLGSVAADLSPSWARPFYREWQKQLWIATAIAGITLYAALLYWLLEHRAEGRYQLGSAGAVDGLERGGLYSFSASYWYIVALCVVFYSVVFRSALATSISSGARARASSATAQQHAAEPAMRTPSSVPRAGGPPVALHDPSLAAPAALFSRHLSAAGASSLWPFLGIHEPLKPPDHARSASPSPDPGVICPRRLHPSRSAPLGVRAHTLC